MSDGKDVSTADLVCNISAAWNRKPHVFSLNPGLLRLLGCLTGKQAMIKPLTEPLVIDSSKARRMLGWTPPFSIDDELDRTAEWYRRNTEGVSDLTYINIAL